MGGIVEITQNDIDRVVEINMKNLPEHYSLSFYYSVLEKYPGLFLGWVEENKIVGYVMCRVESRIGYMHKGIVTAGHIISLAVDFEYRGRGIGTALMKEIHRRLKSLYNAEEVSLEVRVSNSVAIELYKKLGYKTMNVIKYYYLDGEDAYLMVKNLEDEQN